MALKDYRTSGGGGWNPFGILSTLAMLIPGAQVAAPWLQGAGAVTSAINGDWTGAAKQGVGLLSGGSLFGSDAAPDVTPSVIDPIQPSITTPGMGIEENPSIFSSTQEQTSNALSNYLSENNLGTYTPEDEAKYQGLLGQYGIKPIPQAVGENADMGTRFADNNIAKQPRSDLEYQNRYSELLSQYNLSDMDWTKRRKRNGLMGGL